jgi:hypothetical protein
LIASLHTEPINAILGLSEEQNVIYDGSYTIKFSIQRIETGSISRASLASSYANIHIYTGHYVARVLLRIKNIQSSLSKKLDVSVQRVKPVYALRIISQTLPDNRHPKFMVADDKVRYLSCIDPLLKM